MSKDYYPLDWYWRVGGDQTRVYSSARGDYFPNADAAFVAWSADGTVPANIDTEANLGDLLAQLQIRPTAPGVLDGYTNTLADKAVLAMTFKILFNHENRIRTLAGQPQITAQQFRNAIKALM